MDKIAVFSYFNNIGIQNSSGFSSFKDYLYSQTLAIVTAKKHFSKIKFITNDFGQEQLEKIGLNKLISEFDLSLNQYNNLDKHFWGFTKIHAYNQQKESFIHIDNDFYCWDIPDRLRNSSFGFQSIEKFDKKFYQYYDELINIMNKAPYQPQTIPHFQLKYAHNCGIVSCNQRFDIIEEWFNLAKNYITDNKEHLLNYNPHYKIHLNLLHEQYFIAVLLEHHKIEKNNIFHYISNNDFNLANQEGNRFTHLWGDSKKDENVIIKVKNRVAVEQPEIASMIELLY